MVEAGDLQGLFDGLQNSPSGLLDVGQVFAQIQRAVVVALKRNPNLAANEIFEQMLGFYTHIRLRLQYLCTKELSNSDGVHSPRSMVLSREFLDVLFPMAKDLDLHLCQVLQAWTSCRRQLELEQRHQKAQPEAPTPTKESRRRKPRARSKPRSRLHGRLGPGPL